MGPPVRTDSESIRDEKVKVLKAIAPLDEKCIVRGQFRGYQSENGVAGGSRAETFATLKLEVNFWRWQGVSESLAGLSAASRSALCDVRRIAQPASSWKSQGGRRDIAGIRIQPSRTPFAPPEQSSTRLARKTKPWSPPDRCSTLQ